MLEIIQDIRIQISFSEPIDENKLDKKYPMIEMGLSKVVKKETMRKTSWIAAIQVFSSKQFIY